MPGVQSHVLNRACPACRRKTLDTSSVSRLRMRECCQKTHNKWSVSRARGECKHLLASGAVIVMTLCPSWRAGRPCEGVTRFAARFACTLYASCMLVAVARPIGWRERTPDPCRELAGGAGERKRPGRCWGFVHGVSVLSCAKVSRSIIGKCQQRNRRYRGRGRQRLTLQAPQRPGGCRARPPRSSGRDVRGPVRRIGAT